MNAKQYLTLGLGLVAGFGISVAGVSYASQNLVNNVKQVTPEVAKSILENITNEFVILAKELVPNGNVRVIEAVQLPENPVAPNKTMNIAIAFLLGLMVSVGLVFLIEYLDNTFKNKENLEIS